MNVYSIVGWLTIHESRPSLPRPASRGAHSAAHRTYRRQRQHRFHMLEQIFGTRHTIISQSASRVCEQGRGSERSGWVGGGGGWRGVGRNEPNVLTRATHTHTLTHTPHTPRQTHSHMRTHTSTHACTRAHSRTRARRHL